jgi:lysophospholipase L1-like esterase
VKIIHYYYFFGVAPLPASALVFDLSNTSTGYGQNGYDVQGAGYRQRSALAEISFSTDASSVDVELSVTYPNGNMSIGYLINGAFTGFFSGNTTIQLPVGGTKTLKFIEGARQRATNGDMFSGIFLTKVTFPAGSTNRIVAPVATQQRDTVTGDSIVATAAEPVGSRDGWIIKARATLARDIITLAWGGRSWGVDLNTAAKQNAEIDRIIASGSQNHWIALGTNDAGLGLGTPSQVGQYAGEFVDKLHQRAPGVTIRIQTPLTRYDGVSITDYANAIKALKNTRSWLIIIDATGWLSGNDVVAYPPDGIHPTVAGELKLADFYCKTLNGLATPGNQAVIGWTPGAVGETVQETDSRIKTFGQWNRGNKAPASAGLNMFTYTAGGYYEIQFNGTGVRIGYELNSVGGSCTAFIDGNPVGNFSQYGATPVAGQFFDATTTTSGLHTLRVQRTDSGATNGFWCDTLQALGGTFPTRVFATGDVADSWGSDGRFVYDLPSDGEAATGWIAANVGAPTTISPRLWLTTAIGKYTRCTFDVPAEGGYYLEHYSNLNPVYGTAQVLLNGQPAGDPYSAYAAAPSNVNTSVPVYRSPLLAGGTYELTQSRIADASDTAQRNNVGNDYWQLVKA